MLSHANLLERGRGLRRGRGHPRRRRTPVATCRWPGSATRCSRWRCSLLVGFTCNFPERPETVQRDLRELGPTARAGAAAHMGEHADRRAWSGRPMHRSLKRQLFEYFRGVAERAELLRGDGQPVPIGLQAAARDRRVRRLRAGARSARAAPRALGLYRRRAARRPTRSASSASFGVNLKQIYGATELCGAVSRCSPTARPIPNTVGRVFPGIEVRIDRYGEVLVRSPGMFKGYYKQPRGDPRRHDRRTAGCAPATPASSTGAAISSSSIARKRCRQARRRHGVRAAIHREQAQIQPVYRRGGRVRRRPAVCRGDRSRSMPTTVGNWAERHNLAYTSFQDLSARPEVRALIRDEIRKCNAGLPEAIAHPPLPACSTRNSTPTTTRSPAPARSAAALSPRNTPRSSTLFYGGARRGRAQRRRSPTRTAARRCCARHRDRRCRRARSADAAQTTRDRRRPSRPKPAQSAEAERDDA